MLEKEEICIFCGSVAKTELMKESLAENATPYRFVNCKNCGDYIRPDMPWLFAIGYNSIDNIKLYLSKNKKLEPQWNYIGDTCFFEKNFVKYNDRFYCVSIDMVNE